MKKGTAVYGVEVKIILIFVIITLVAIAFIVFGNIIPAIVNGLKMIINIFQGTP